MEEKQYLLAIEDPAERLEALKTNRTAAIIPVVDQERLVRELDVDMIGLGPFIPHAGTPLGGAKCGSVELALKLVAVMRLVTKDTNIPATTALGVLDKEARLRALSAGANVLMPVFTPQDCAGAYGIYPGKEEGRLGHEVTDYGSMFAGMGRSLGRGYGNRRQGREAAREEKQECRL